MIDAQLWANGQTGQRFRNWRLDIDADCERAISWPAPADSARIDDWLTGERTHGIMRISKLRGIEALVVAPDFAAIFTVILSLIT